MTAALALLSSLLWGGADFLGGTVSRRLPALVVIGASQLVALVALVPVAVATGGLSAPRGHVLPALGAGVVGLVALTCFYRALASGTMGVVAPVAALGVALPVAAGLAAGEQPSAAQLLGIAVALVGVVLASGPELRGTAAGQRLPLVLAGIAAAGFGGVLLLVAEGSDSSVVMTLLTMRATTVTVLLVAAVARRHRPRLARTDLPLIAIVGIADVSANAAFAVASTSGLVSVVSVLSSLYPAVTVLLAWRVLGERLRTVQTVGVVATLTGVVLLAGG